MDCGYDKIVASMMAQAKESIMGFSSEIVRDGDYVVIINVLKLGEEEDEEEQG